MNLDKFKELYSSNVSKEVDKDYKGLSYLSWATAYKLAMEADPELKYEVLEDQDGFPLFSRGELHIVKTRVFMFGEWKQMILPVMDNNHNAVKSVPYEVELRNNKKQKVEALNTRQINDNIMRCLAKNIAMFGIGLSLYTGEDTAQYRYEAPETPEQKAVKMIMELDPKQSKTELETMTIEQLRKRYTDLKSK